MALKTVWERSWGHLGLVLAGLGGQNRAPARAGLIFSKINVLNKSGDLGGSWADLEPF